MLVFTTPEHITGPVVHALHKARTHTESDYKMHFALLITPKARYLHEDGVAAQRSIRQFQPTGELTYHHRFRLMLPSEHVSSNSTRRTAVI